MKKLLASGIAAASTLALPLPAFAQDVDPCQVGAGQTAPLFCDLSELTIGGIVGQVVNLVFFIAILLAFGFLVYGGIKWLTSGGDKEGVASARNTIIAAIIGLVIVFIAFVVLNFLVQWLTGAPLNEVVVPRLR